MLPAKAVLPIAAPAGAALAPRGVTVRAPRRRRAGVVRAGDSPGGSEDDVGALFKKELERRQISSVDDIVDAPSGSGRRGGFSTPPPDYARTATDSQLERSRALNSEGLEGLIPRVTELVKLGGSFFLAFGPFIVGVALAFACVYAVFGSSFVHSGRPSAGPPTYIDPIELLNEPTIDPMVPL